MFGGESVLTFENFINSIYKPMEALEVVTCKLRKLLSSETLSCYQRLYGAEKNHRHALHYFQNRLGVLGTVDTLKTETSTRKQFR